MPENPYKAPQAELESRPKSSVTSELRWIVVIAKGFGVIVTIALLGLLVYLLLAYRALFLNR